MAWHALGSVWAWNGCDGMVTPSRGDATGRARLTLRHTERACYIRTETDLGLLEVAAIDAPHPFVLRQEAAVPVNVSAPVVGHPSAVAMIRE